MISQFAVRYRNIIYCLVLILSVIIVYSRIADHDFVNIDDPYQVTEEIHVLTGLTWENIRWSFGPESRCSPLTWIAYASGHTLFGLNSGMFHVMSLIIHIASSVLLFYLLIRMTGEFWKSAFVGALFALHPINVESVAWIAELNNVLSGLFFMLTLLLYTIYVEQPTWKRYVLALLAFGLGLLAKPVLMTLPFILFLIDLWPLKRIHLEKREDTQKVWGMKIQGATLSRIILEKVPFMILSFVSLISNISGAEMRMGLYSADIVPMGLRISNALVSPIKYIGKLLWPHDLAVFYPYPNMVPFWKVAGAVLILLLVTILAVRAVGRRPYFLVGWLWFLGGLIPFLGIIQAGLWPEMADRYAYLTCIGIFIVLSWGIPDLLRRFRYYRTIIAIAGSGVILVLMPLTWIQAGFWKNSETLFSHNLEATENNHLAHYNLGVAFFELGDIQGAISHYRQSLEIRSHNIPVLNNLGLALVSIGDLDGAIKAYQEALEVNPMYDLTHFNLGFAYANKAEVERAIEHFLKGLQVNPSDSKARNYVGDLLLDVDRIDEAIDQYNESLRIDPYQPVIYNTIGNTYMRKGNIKKAIEYYQHAINYNPRNTEAEKNLENARTALAKNEDLISKIKGMIKEQPKNPGLYSKLGELYLRQGEYVEAIAQYQKSISIQPESVQAMYGLAIVYSQKKEYTKALESLQNIRKLKPDNPEVYYNIACIFAKQNMVDESIIWLRKSIEKGFNNLELIIKDPDLSNIRDTEYFKMLLQGRNNE